MEVKKKLDSELNFKSVLKNPLRLFGLVYIYFFVIALAIGIYYVQNLNSFTFNVVPGSSLDTLHIEREIELKEGGIKPAMDLNLITNPTPEMVEKGKALYKTNCASCHGDDGLGNGLASAALIPKPRNFTSTEGWTNGPSFYDIYKTINNGVSGTGMVAYEFLSPEDRVSIIQYIRTFSKYPEVTTAEVQDKLEPEFHLAAGVVEPNTIPIKKSITLFEDENSKNEEHIKKIVGQILIDQNNSAVILKENVSNLSETVSMFLELKRDNNYNNFLNKISIDPYSVGVKNSMLLLDEEKLKNIYSYLNKICS